MAGFASHDAIVNAITVLGQFVSRDLAKQTAPVHTAGGWHLTTGLAGYPNAGTFPGTDLVWNSTDENNGDGTTIIGPPMGGGVGPSMTKHITATGAMIVAAAGAPWQAKLVDHLGYYKLSGANVTGTSSRTLINSETFTASNSGGDLLLTYAQDWKNGTLVQFTTTTTLPTGLNLNTDYWLIRQSATTAKVATSYANYVANTKIAWTDAGTGTHTLTIRPRYAGVGVEALFQVQTAPTAGGPTLSASSYTNAAGTASRAFQGSLVMNAAANAYATRILHSGNAAGNYGAFMPRQGGDTGILSIQSFTWSAGTAYTGSGVVSLSLVRPLGVDLILPATGVWTEKDYLNMIPALPKIEDGACLQWLLFGTGATTTASPLNTRIDAVWG